MAEDSSELLSYAIRGKVVLKYTGQLALMVSVLTLAPLLMAVAEQHWTLVTRYLILSVALFICGITCARVPAPARIGSNEALAITALAFALFPMLMAWPMTSTNIAPVDALFEAISAVTTTGLSTLSTIEERPQTFLFARAWMQWYGGLGIIVLSVTLLMGNHLAVRRLVIPIESGDTLLLTARIHARQTLKVYLLLTVLGILILWPFADNLFTASVHILAAISTGGFSSFDDNLNGFTSPVAGVIVILIALLGSIPLPLYWRVKSAGYKKGVALFFQDIEVRALLGACVLVTSLLLFFHWFQSGTFAFYDSLIMGVSAQTTSGFSSVDVSQMDSASKLVMIVSMLVGGGVGSSAGGIKLLRLLILLRIFQLMLRRAGMPPHAVMRSSFGGQLLEDDDIVRALQLILLFIVIIILSWIPFLVLGYDPLNSLFEVVSASATVGLSAGIVGPQLEDFLKGLLCFNMIAGRVEIIALLVLLYPRSWLGNKGDL